MGLNRLSDGLCCNQTWSFLPHKMADNKHKDKIGEKPQKLDNKASKKPVKATATASASNSSSSEPEILSILKTMQDSIIKQGEKVDSLNSRMGQMENTSYDDYGYNLDSYDPCYEEGEITETRGIEQECRLSAAKRPGDEMSRFDSMTKKFRSMEHVDTEVDTTLAENVNELFHKGIDEDRYEELVKDENNARPENCEGLSVVKTNRLIWDAVSHNSRLNDKKLQNIELSVIKAATILTKTVNNMASIEKDCDLITPMIDGCNNVLALLGHTNRQINLARKDFLKPDLKYEYAHLCNHSVPYTTELFGDDVGKQARDIEDTNKLGTRLQKGGFVDNRGRPGFRGRQRSRGRGFPSRGRPYNATSSYGQVAPGYPAKNYQRRGQSGRNYNK